MRWRSDQALSWIICHVPRKLDQWTPEMGRKLVGAQEELRKAIAEGRVQAWGRPNPQAKYEKVPEEQFDLDTQRVPVGVDVYGEMVPLQAHRPYSGDRWHSLRFEADEIKGTWPKPPPATAMDWMLREAERLKSQGLIGKRDSLVEDCAKATGVTTRKAIEAYKHLPEDLRLKRGKPRKHSE